MDCRALAQAAICDQRDCISEAAIDFHVSDDAFTFGDGIVDTEFAEPQHSHTHTENLAGTEMAVRDFCKF